MKESFSTSQIDNVSEISSFLLLDVLILVFDQIGNDLIYWPEIPLRCLMAVPFMVELEVLPVDFEVFLGLLRLVAIQELVQNTEFGST